MEDFKQDFNNSEETNENGDNNSEIELSEKIAKLKSDPDLTSPARVTIVWRVLILFLWNHLCSTYGIFLICTGQVKWMSIIWMLTVFYLDGIGGTAGAHRLWSHRSYKAKLPLKLFLVVIQTMSGQYSIYDWARDHRVHHKFSETNADPYNSARGFFFAHIGWYMSKKHPQVLIQGRKNDLSDLEKDPIIMFQKRHYYPLTVFMVLFFPVIVAYFGWDEDPFVAFFAISHLAYTLNLHGVSLINSAAHLYGYKPYDKNINPAENLFVTIMSNGEGWHNYHHTFLWDYKASEIGLYNPATAFINFFAWLGLAYDLKNVPQQVIEDRMARTGDGSSNEWDMSHNPAPAAGVWGWGDKTIPKKHLDMTETLYSNSKPSKKSCKGI